MPSRPADRRGHLRRHACGSGITCRDERSAACCWLPRKVLLDCDPGIDDALAIAFACGHPGLDLCGVTTVAGNIGLAQTTANALSVLEFVGRPDVPLAEGSAAPLLRPHVDARDVHGDSGLGQARLPPAQARPVDADATDLIIDTIGAPRRGRSPWSRPAR